MNGCETDEDNVLMTLKTQSLAVLRFVEWCGLMLVILRDFLGSSAGGNLNLL